MLEDYQEKQRNKLARSRAFMDYTMGTLLALIGVFFIVYRFFGIRLMDREPSPIDFALGIVFILYGSLRIYRGYKKNYFQ